MRSYAGIRIPGQGNLRTRHLLNVKSIIPAASPPDKDPRTFGHTSLRTVIFPDKVPESIAFGLFMSGICMFGAFQDAKRTGNGLVYTLCKGWSRYPRLLRGVLRARRDGEAAAVAHLAPHLPRRSTLMIPQPPSTTLPPTMMPRIPISPQLSIILQTPHPNRSNGYPFYPFYPFFHHFTHFTHFFTILPIFSPFYPFSTILPIFEPFYPFPTIVSIRQPFNLIPTIDPRHPSGRCHAADVSHRHCW